MPASNDGQGVVDAVGQLAGEQAVEQRLALGVRRRPGVEAASATRRAAAAPRSTRLAGVLDAPRRRRRRSSPGRSPSTSLTAASSSAPRAEPWILPVFCFFGRRPADDRLQDDDRRLVGLGLRRLDGRVQLGDVLDVLAGLLPVDGLHVPAVGLVALRDVFGEGDVGVVLDRDLVGVVDRRRGCRAAGGRRARRPRW